MGNSGGPLINLDGEVVGINSVKLASPAGLISGIGFAIAIDDVKDIVKELKSKGFVSRPYIGITGIALGAEIKEYLKATASEMSLTVPNNLAHGVYLHEVAPRSPASVAGLREGMVLTEVNGKPVRNTTEVMKILWDKVGMRVSLKVLDLRKGHEGVKEIVVVPSTAPPLRHRVPILG